MFTILIVDDQPEIRRLLQITLGNEFEVLEAADGTSALQMLQAHQPRVVLLDVMMPGLIDGLGVLDVIKGNPQTQDIAVAMLTARGQHVDQQDACARGADAYFTKPFSPLKVLAWVREHMRAPDTGSSDYAPL